MLVTIESLTHAVSLPFSCATAQDPCVVDISKADTVLSSAIHLPDTPTSTVINYG